MRFIIKNRKMTQVDTSMTIYVATHRYLRKSGKYALILLGYSPNEDHITDYLFAVMLKTVYGISAKKEDRFKWIFDPKMPNEIVNCSGEFLMFAPDVDQDDDEEQPLTILCEKTTDTDERDKLIIYHYDIQSEPIPLSDRTLKGIFTIEKTHSTVFDMVDRTTAADQRLEAGFIDPSFVGDV